MHRCVGRSIPHDRPHEASPLINLVTNEIPARLPVVVAGGFNRWRGDGGALDRRNRGVTSGRWRSDASSRVRKHTR
jgi:hypothetical protein